MREGVNNLFYQPAVEHPRGAQSGGGGADGGAGSGVSDPRVIEAMAEVPRHEFVPAELRRRAYEDRALPIGYEQTISQPFIVAFDDGASRAEVDGPRAGDRHRLRLPGGGALAAGEAGLFHRDHRAAGRSARRRISPRLGYRNVQVRAGDGYQGWPEAAPFDAIIVTCAPDHVPEPLVAQLREGGRMMIPVGPPGAQELVLLEKKAGRLEQKAVLPVRFVPMTGEARSRR